MLGLWIEQTEGAKFWLEVMNELKTRGVNDVLIAVVDRLKACPREGEGLCRGDRHSLSADHGADPGSGPGQALHHSSDPQLPGFCVPRLRGAGCGRTAS